MRSIAMTVCSELDIQVGSRDSVSWLLMQPLKELWVQFFDRCMLLLKP